MIKNFEEKAIQSRKNQPLMGLKAYNLKTKSSDKTEEFNSEFKKFEELNPKISKNKSLIFNKIPTPETLNELNIFKSDSNLKRDIENQELYEYLVNYESNQLYRNTANELKALSDEIRLNLDSNALATQSDNNLTPFLEESRECCNLQPLLSSTAAEFDKDLSDFILPITPLRFVSNMSKLKKLRSFSNMNIDN